MSSWFLALRRARLRKDIKLGSEEEDDETWLCEDLRSCEEVEGSRSLLPVIYSRYLPIFDMISRNDPDGLESRIEWR